ncbi:hypothetical protein DP939_02390 [Spongiactinospora rosea]|uniref:Uncharacterized protein n=1 Tax=Spongiactinospora rosea TaxID=2248750 RepID=A0A366M770_9ACTN|nr:hypothetical protein [Spongiactinospora rosea]RBQ21580.1 hypothetical protein DP939_02390 [Spongiactinospora rosea]
MPTPTWRRAIKVRPLPDYLRERWDEEEAELDRLLGMRRPQRYIRIHGERMRADIFAKRKILAECENMDSNLARLVLTLLAEPYADRLDGPARS